MKNSILIVMILAFSLLFNSCSLYEKVFDKSPEDAPEDTPADVPADVPEDDPADVPEDDPADVPAKVKTNICAQSGVEIPVGECMKMMKGDEVLWFSSEEMLFAYLKDNKMTWMHDKIMLKEEGVNYCEVCSMQIFEDEGLKYMLEDKEIWFANEKMLNIYLEKNNMKLEGEKIVPFAEENKDDKVYPDEKNEKDEVDDDDDIVDPYKAYRHMLNDEAVKEVVDGFMSAVQTGNDIEFQSCIDWDKVAANAQKTVERVKKYFNITDLQKALSYFNVEISFPERLSYFNKRSGLDHNVGYGIWKLTPNGEIGSECQWIIKLKFYTQTQKWVVVSIGGLPQDVMGYKTCNFAIPDEERELYVLYIYYFTPEQWYAFKKNEKLDPMYVPETTEEWHHRREVGTKKFEKEDYIDPDSSGVEIPELIKNVNLDSDYSDKISAVKKGELESSKKFTETDKKRDVVATLINIILEGAKDSFKSKLSADAAVEANKALQKIFGKTSGIDKMTYGFRISKQSDDGKPVDDDNIQEVVDVVICWIDEFTNLGWSVE
ncbi:MAG: hypothetical protein K8S87_12705 [Planctomycetes bacterium]|nr:hypothetical protein [Planctomycetota bacterium]